LLVLVLSALVPAAAAPSAAAGTGAVADARGVDLGGWTPIVRERGSKVTRWRGDASGPRHGLRLTTGPGATGLAALGRVVAPRRHVVGRGVVQLKRLGVRRGETRALITVGAPGAGIQGGVVRTRSGRLRWALWASNADGARRRIDISGRVPSARRWHRIGVRTVWRPGGRTRATLRVDGVTVARLKGLATGPSGPTRVIVGLGRPDRRSSRTVAILTSWTSRAWGPVVGVAGSRAIAPGAAGSGMPWSADFETGNLSQFRLSEAFLEDRAVVAPAPTGGTGQALRVRVGGTPRDTGRWGVDLRGDFASMGLGAGVEEAYLRYRVYFPVGFDFQKGGKLPGLSGLSPGQPAGSTSAGGTYDESSFSARIMWKQRVEGTGGGVISYMYVKQADGQSISDDTGRFIGISPRWTWGAEESDPYAAFEEGAWNLVELYYRLNTPGQADGVHQAWLNGRPALALDDVEYRTAANPGLKINQLFFAVFYGGWEVAETPYDIWIDDVAIGPRRP
jgi:hypothetical protein